MSDAYEYAVYLAQEIGPRPAGTKEEQQASYFIEGIFKNEALLNTSVHEFSCNVHSKLPKAIINFLAVLFIFLAFFVNALVIPTAIICLICAVLSLLIDLNKLPATKFNKKGISQNIIAKYMPQFNTKGLGGESSRGGRKRKIVLLANYDTDKVDYSLKSPIIKAYKYLNIAESVCICIIFFISLLRVFSSEGDSGIFLNIILIIACLVCLLPLAWCCIRRFSPYDPGANCNASGIGVMLEIAKNITTHKDLTSQKKSNTKDITNLSEIVNDSIEAVEEEKNLYDNYEELKHTTEKTTEGQLDQGLYINSITNEREESVQDDTRIVNDLCSVIEATEDKKDSLISDIQEEDVLQEVIKGPTFENEPELAVPEWYKKAISKANRDIYSETPVKRSKFGDALRAAEELSEGAIEQEIKDTFINEKTLSSQANGVTKLGVDGFLAHSTKIKNYEEQNLNDSNSDTPSQKNADGLEEAFVCEAVNNEPVIDSDVLERAQRTISFIPVASNIGEQIENTVDNNKSQDEKQNLEGKKHRREIVLPSLTGAIEGLTGRLQSAPLENEESRNKSLGETRIEDKIHHLEETLPSMDKTAALNLEDINKHLANVSTAGSFVAAEATSSFSAVGNDLVADVAEDEIYIEDADDSDYETQFTELGAPTGPGYVDMPKKRGPKFLQKLRKKKDNNNEVSLSEAIGVDESFDARTIGAKRGSWESFKNSSSGDTSVFKNSETDWDDDWEGGAFSIKEKLNLTKQLNRDNGEGLQERRKKNKESIDSSNRRNTALNDSRRRGEYSNPFGDIVLSDTFAQEREELYEIADHFVDTEVWFVALGASYSDNAGMRELLEKNREELKGAVFINLCALGAGNIAIATKEGRIVQTTPSSRLKRYANKAATSLGVRLGSVDITWRNTASFLAQKAGYQSIHICGVEGDKPAYLAQADDSAEILDEQTIELSTALITDIIHAI